METFVKAMAGIIGVIVLIVVLGLIMSWPVMMLWNGCLVDAVSGVKEIGWLQAWGILILCGFLFKSSTSGSK
jgi:hypothetical protein